MSSREFTVTELRSIIIEENSIVYLTKNKPPPCTEGGITLTEVTLSEGTLYTFVNPTHGTATDLRRWQFASNRAFGQSEITSNKATVQNKTKTICGRVISKGLREVAPPLRPQDMIRKNGRGDQEKAEVETRHWKCFKRDRCLQHSSAIAVMYQYPALCAQDTLSGRS